MDWQLGLFRFGLLACFAGMLTVATQFDLTKSIEAVWFHAATTSEIQSQDASATKRVAACLSTRAKTRGVEYASGCYYDQSAIPELAGDEADENLLGFFATSLVVFAIAIALGLMGRRMARESQV